MTLSIREQARKDLEEWFGKQIEERKAALQKLGLTPEAAEAAVTAELNAIAIANFYGGGPK